MPASAPRCESYDWTGVYPELHTFCATDLSAFYFDIRKDAIYCDRPDSLRRRAARTVLDHLHRCLTTWLAPVLCLHRGGGLGRAVRRRRRACICSFSPTLPAAWRDDALAAKWETIRAIRRRITVPIEEARAANTLGASLAAAPRAAAARPTRRRCCRPTEWAEIAIVSALSLSTTPPSNGAFALPDAPGVAVVFAAASGEKCARCWRVLPEVGGGPTHPALCLRCTDAVASGLSYRRAAE